MNLRPYSKHPFTKYIVGMKRVDKNDYGEGEQKVRMNEVGGELTSVFKDLAY